MKFNTCHKGLHKSIVSVELAGLPTPLTPHPLPSYPSTFPLPPPPTNYTAGY